MNETDILRLAAAGTGGILGIAWLLRIWLSARGLMRSDAASEHTADYYMLLIKAQTEEIARLRQALADCEHEVSGVRRHGEG
jgi:hypothetical protein